MQNFVILTIENNHYQHVITAFSGKAIVLTLIIMTIGPPSIKYILQESFVKRKFHMAI